MKILKYINTFAIGLPILLLILGIIINDAAGNWIGLALFSTILTGLIQVLLGLFLLIKNIKNKYLNIYIIAVILFFLLYYLNVNIFYSDIFYFFLYPIPLILATYFSLIIYKKLYL
jgi:hypothetical protein